MVSPPAQKANGEGCGSTPAAVDTANHDESGRAFPRRSLGKEWAIEAPALALTAVTGCYSETAEATSPQSRVVESPWPGGNSARDLVIPADQLRHTFACLWLEQGGGLAALQRILGHASITTTQRYAMNRPGIAGGSNP